MSESSPACPSCQISLSKARKVLGPTPLVARGVTDLTSTFTAKDLRVTHRAIANFEEKFAGSQFNVVIYNFDQKLNLGTSLFWLFNSIGLSSTKDSHGRNRDFLLGIDPAGGRAGITIGYGLEPFLVAEDLARVSAKARPALEVRDYSRACEQVIAGCSSLLRRRALDAQATFGIKENTAKEATMFDY